MNNRHRPNNQGVVLLNRRVALWDGKPPPYPWPDDYTNEDVYRGRHRDWHVIRHTPKTTTWAISTHGSARLHHVIKYQLVATNRRTGVIEKKTVWLCGRHSQSEIRPTGKPNPLRKRCWHCDHYSP